MEGKMEGGRVRERERERREREERWGVEGGEGEGRKEEGGGRRGGSRVLFLWLFHSMGESNSFLFYSSIFLPLVSLLSLSLYCIVFFFHS